MDAFRRSGRNALRVLGASGQLGYGVPTPAFQAGLAREPDIIGCDMGSIDIGPYYLGAGRMATAPAATRRDLRKVIVAARQHDIPLVIGSAGSAGAAPHLDATLAMVRDIAREDGLHFRLGVLRADMPRDLLRKAVHAGKVHGIDGMPALTLEEVDAASEIVGQMGSSAFQRGLAAGVDVLIAGRACDTGIFASLPMMLGLPARSSNAPRSAACRAGTIPYSPRWTPAVSNWRAWRCSAAPHLSRSPRTAFTSSLIRTPCRSRRAGSTYARRATMRSTTAAPV
jgi:hypothetical protein